MKTSHTSIVRYNEINLDLSWKLPFYWVAFRVSEGATQDTDEEKPPSVFHSLESYEPYYQPAR